MEKLREKKRFAWRQKTLTKQQAIRWWFVDMIFNFFYLIICLLRIKFCQPKRFLWKCGCRWNNSPSFLFWVCLSLIICVWFSVFFFVYLQLNPFFWLWNLITIFHKFIQSWFFSLFFIQLNSKSTKKYCKWFICFQFFM